MNARSLFPFVLSVLLFLSGCAPALTGEQLVEYERYVSARATEGASELAIAEARVTQVAAARLIAQASVSTVMPATAVVTAGPTGQVIPQTPTPLLLTSAGATAVLTATSTVVPTATHAAVATPSRTPPPTATRTPQPTVQPEATATPAVTATMQITAAAGMPAVSTVLTATLAITATPPIASPITVTAGVTVEIRAANANLRGGPGTEFDVVTTASQGQEFAVSGRTADASWWQVCCVDGKPAWVIDSLVAIQGARDLAPVRAPLMPDNLEATWAIHWLCYAEGCPQPECLGESKAQALQLLDARWLEVKRQSNWPDKCGKTEDWLVQVDRFTGQEAQATSDPPLFYVWMGAVPGPENRTFEHLGRTLSLWCTDTRTREVAQTGGWTALFDGQACYDRGSGMLVTMEYTKRWLFTGTAGGQQYERKYFGDYEVYQQMLVDTNVPLSAK